MFKTITAKALSGILAAAVAIGTFAVPAKASPAKPYTGTWTSAIENSDLTASMTIFEDGTVCVVFSDEPGVGYYFTSAVWEDGSLVVIDGSEIVASFGLYGQNQLLDLDSGVWTKIM